MLSRRLRPSFALRMLIEEQIFMEKLLQKNAYERFSLLTFFHAAKKEKGYGRKYAAIILLTIAKLINYLTK